MPGDQLPEGRGGSEGKTKSGSQTVARGEAFAKNSPGGLGSSGSDDLPVFSLRFGGAPGTALRERRARNLSPWRANA